MLRDLFRHFVDIIEELFKQEEIWLFILLVGLAGLLFIFIPNINWLNLLIILSPFIVFVILFPIFKSLWLFWRQSKFKKAINFVLLELRIPRAIQKTPEAMEQVLAAIIALRNSANDIKEKYWDGEVTRWYTLEMVSFGGEIHFYIRTYKNQRNLIEAAFFSYYSGIELIEVEDYVNRLPKDIFDIYNRDLDMWGTEMVLSKEAVYPIKTYPHFEGEVEERENDPIATFLEVLSKVKPGEFVGIQIELAPKGLEWKDKWLPVLDKLREPATIVVSSPASDEEGSKSRAIPIARSPGQLEILEGIEDNLTKPAFDTLIRFIYLSPKEIFTDTFPRRGLIGAFNQYSALHLNSFRQNYPLSTRTRIWNWPHLFPHWRNEYKKQRLLHNYFKREVPPETWMGRLMTSYPLNLNFASKRFDLNIEGVATIFHPPSQIVLTEPHIKHLESKRMGPPAGLHIYTEEEDLKKFN